MEFTPFTGLRLRVPLQWVPIQLMVSKWYKDVPGSSEHQLRQQNRMLCKALKTPLSWQLQFSLQKARKTKSWQSEIGFTYKQQSGKCTAITFSLSSVAVYSVQDIFFYKLQTGKEIKQPIITEKGRLQQGRHLKQEITAISPHALLKHVIYKAVGWTVIPILMPHSNCAISLSNRMIPYSKNTAEHPGTLL